MIQSSLGFRLQQTRAPTSSELLFFHLFLQRVSQAFAPSWVMCLTANKDQAFSAAFQVKHRKQNIIHFFQPVVLFDGCWHIGSLGNATIVWHVIPATKWCIVLRIFLLFLAGHGGICLVRMVALWVGIGIFSLCKKSVNATGSKQCQDHVGWGGQQNFAALFKNLMLDGGNPALVVVLVEGRGPSSSGTPPCYWHKIVLSVREFCEPTFPSNFWFKIVKNKIFSNCLVFLMKTQEWMAPRRTQV